MSQRIRFVVYRYQHHSPHSGYSRVAEFGSKQFNADIIRVDKPLSRKIIRERMLWRIAKGTPGYDRASMAAELKVAANMLRESGSIYHFLYGETTYHYAGLLNNFRGNRIVATFHLPLAGFQRAVQREDHLRRLSAIVCVGNSQKEFFKDVIDPQRVFFVPLGVDTSYYTPPENFEVRDPDLCLIVGANFRDYPTLRGVIELVSFRRPNTRFVAVCPPSTVDLIGYHPNLTITSGLSEDELTALYRSAALLLMPVTDATANNAILEGMACGVPLISTDVGSIRDYMSPQCGVFTPLRDARSMADATIDLLESPSLRKQMSIHCRNQALKFDWPLVVGQLQSVYDAVN